MFTDIYVSMQAGRVLQERRVKEASQGRLALLAAHLRRTLASK